MYLVKRRRLRWREDRYVMFVGLKATRQQGSKAETIPPSQSLLPMEVDKKD
jgi:hypothetical protein